MRRRYSGEQWRSWFLEHGDSGLTISEFCRRKGVPENSFYRWRKKLSEEVADEASAFVPISVVSSSRMEIDLPCGATVRVPTESLAVRCVLGALLELGGDS